MSIERTVTRCLSAVATACVLASCATAYGPAGLGGGYSDTRIDSNVFLIGFKGNVRLSQAQTNEMALLHAAEVTLRQGFVYFASSGAAPTGTALSVATNTIAIPASTLTITCFVEPPDTSVPIFDARAVVASLGPIYLR